MMTDLTWNEFCELYYETAKVYAETHINRLRAKLGDFDKRVDLEYVRDAAVLSSLEKVYTHFDSKRGTKITSYLSTIVHNEIVDEISKETKKAVAQQDVDDLKTAIRAYADDGSAEARAKLIPRLMAAISKLSPSDQVILNYYLEDKSSYIARSSEILCVSENYVSVRRNRIFKLLPKLMDMTRSEYLQYCLQIESNAFAGQIELHPTRSFRPNPILPSLSYGVMVEKIFGMI